MKKAGIFFVTILLLGGGLTSCENFFNGAELRTEIENQIAYANATECTLIVKNDSAYGSFLSAGEKKCKVGYTTYLQFTATTEDYCFMGLEAVSTSDNSVSRGDFVEFTVTNEDEALTTGVYKITVKLLNEANDILIRPKFEKLSNADIKITGAHGKFNPEKDTYNLIIGRTFSLSFEPDSDYEFIRWQIYEENTGDEIADKKYLTFKNIADRNTSFTFTGVPENSDITLAVRPVVAERAQIISYSPMYTSNGVLKDTTIQVLFDRDMDENSIYYTKEEIISLNDSGSGIAYDSFLPPVDEEELSDTGTLGKHYGYKDEDGETFFKNISIKDNETSDNFNYCFGAPYFENARTLSVNVKKDSSNNVSIVDYSRLLVTIEKDFFYSEKIDETSSKPVTLAGSKKWMYQVNDEKDTVAPVIANASSDCIVKINGNAISSAATHTVSSSTTFNNGKKMSLTLKTTDTGSGPADQFTVYLQRVQNSSYANVSDSVKKTGVNYQRVTSQNGIVNKEIDLANLFGDLSDGMYRVNFEFKDRSGNAKTYPEGKYYYFAVDNGITMATPTVTDNSDKNGIKLTLKWTPPADLNSTKIRYKKNGGSWSSWETVSTNPRDYSSLALNKSYSFEMSTTDYAGHSKTFSFSAKTPDLSISVSGTPQKTFYFNDEQFDSSGLTVTASLTNNKSWTLGASEYTTNLSPSVICGTGKTVAVSYSKFDVTRSANINATYYVASSDARPTETPVKLTGYTGTLSGGTYYKFGDFPQTVKAYSVEVSSSPVYNGWYLGSDGYFYEKCTENAYTDYTYAYSNGTTARNSSANSTRYFKVEPIKWRVLANNYDVDGKAGTATGHLLLAENILTGNIPYYGSTTNRTLNNKTIYSNNYMYSNIRAYLNGTANQFVTNGSTATGSEIDWTNKGFLQKAFTADAQSKITSTYVKNDWTTIYPKDATSRNMVCPYTCLDTSDKIFLLSANEVTTGAYGFTESSSLSDGNSRIRMTTDYAKANYVAQYSGADQGGHWWLRSPADHTGIYANNVFGNGAVSFFSSNKVDSLLYGIVPALCVSTLP